MILNSSQNDVETTAKEGRRLTVAYVGSLSLIIASLCIAYFTIESARTQQSNDARLINISGRQRMLSQNLALLVTLNGTSVPRQLAIDLHNDIARRTSEILKGHTEVRLGIQEMRPTPEISHIDSLLRMAEPSIQRLVEIAQFATATGWNDQSIVNELVSLSQKVLREMDEVTFTLEAHSDAKSRSTERTILIALGTIILVVLLEALWIFRPIVRSTTDALDSSRRANANAIQSEENLRRLVRILPDITFLFDRTGTYVEIFTSREDLLVESRSLLLGKRIPDVFDDEHSEQFMDIIGRTFETGAATPFSYALHIDGTTTWFTGVATRLEPTATEDAYVVMIVRDVSAEHIQEQSAERIQDTLMRAAIDMQEAERERIADDLHDGLGQRIALLKMKLEYFIRQRAQESGDTLLRDIDDIANNIREIAHDIAPATLRTFGLVEAMKNSLRMISESSSIRVTMQFLTESERFDVMTERGLYRVYQELITNILRHASATEITVQLVEHPNRLVFVLEDNGVGFDTSQLAPRGRGLIGVQARVRVMQGELTVDSAPKRGTCITVSVPTNLGEES